MSGRFKLIALTVYRMYLLQWVTTVLQVGAEFCHRRGFPCAESCALEFVPLMSLGYNRDQHSSETQPEEVWT
jgi:hypothetical protein